MGPPTGQPMRQPMGQPMPPGPQFTYAKPVVWLPILALLCIVLSLAGGFLPWVDIPTGGLMLGELDGYTKLLLICHVIPLILLVITMAVRRWNVAYRVFAALFVLNMLLALALYIMIFVRIDSVLRGDDYDLRGLAGPGIGLYLSAAFALIALILGILALVRRRKKLPSVPHYGQF